MNYLFRDKSSGVFYFRFQIPPQYRSLFENKCVIKKSLKTYNRKDARLKALKLELEVRERMTKDDEIVLSYVVAKKTLVMTSIVNYLDVNKAPSVFLKATQDLVDRYKIKDKDSFEEFILEGVDFDTARLNAIYNPEKGTPAEQANDWMKITPLAKELPLAQKVQLKTQLTRLFNCALNVRKCIADGRSDKVGKILADFESYLSEEGRAEKLRAGESIDRVQQAPKPKAVNINTVLESYRKESLTKGTSEKTVNTKVAQVRTLHELIQKQNMLEVNRDDANKGLEMARLYPKDVRQERNKKHFNGLTADKVVRKNRKLELPLINETTANRYVENASTIYKWAKQHNLISYNPWEGLGHRTDKRKKDSDKKLPFDEADLKLIFGDKVFKGGDLGKSSKTRLPLNYKYWMPLIALHTGMRPSEIAQLYKEDVEEIEGIWCFKLQANREDQSLKNRNAWRIVPLHSELIRLGLVDFIHQVKAGERLFKELNYSKNDKYLRAVTGWFKKTYDFNGQSKTFYSFRHTFINEFKQKGDYDAVLCALVGHEHGSITFDIYGGDIKPAVLKERIEQINFKNLLEDVEHCSTSK
ncbi:site-specific integrase [Vibrio casei]|uniref:site-specific integrase n=1 Tax=Vibrio casei TaxID=673372 RepID=UPI003F96A06B